MNTNLKLRSLAATVAFASVGAFAQSTSTPPSPPTPKMTGDAARAESDYRAAQTACNAQPVASRDQCLRDAKTKYDRVRDMNGKGDMNSMNGKSSKGGGNDSSGADTGTASGDNAGHGGAGAPGAGSSSSGGTAGAGAGGAGAGSNK